MITENFWYEDDHTYTSSPEPDEISMIWREGLFPAEDDSQI